jgi:hypothetical protein
MDAATKCHMPAWCLPGQIDGLGVIKHCGVTVGRTPEQDYRCPDRDLDTTECRVIRYVAHVIAKRWLQPQRLLHEHGDQLRTLTQLTLKLSIFSQDADSIPDQARSGFTTSAQQGVEDDDGFDFGERLTGLGSRCRT